MISLVRSALALMRKNKLDSYLEKLKSKGLCIGEGTSVLEPFFLDPYHCFLISIGKNSTLAPNVRLIAHDASTKQYLGYTRIGRIMIGDNCFIGDSVIILPNVTIGSNTIVGSGSIVNKDIPENVVAAGNPVRIICKLEEYLERIEREAKVKGVFSDDYHIDKITPHKRDEILQSLTKGESFII